MEIKVKAFTLNEMIIVMVISVIVMGLAFTVLSMVQNHMWSIQSNVNMNTEFNRLEQALWIDTNKSGDMSYDNVTDILEFKSELKITTYTFNKETVIKDKDTFRITIGKKVFFFNGNTVGSGKIDALRLEQPKPFMNQQLFIYKENDAKQFVE